MVPFRYLIMPQTAFHSEMTVNHNIVVSLQSPQKETRDALKKKKKDLAQTQQQERTAETPSGPMCEKR